MCVAKFYFRFLVPFQSKFAYKPIFNVTHNKFAESIAFVT